MLYDVGHGPQCQGGTGPGPGVDVGRGTLDGNEDGTGTATRVAGGNGSSVGNGAAMPLVTMVAARLRRNDAIGALRANASGAIDNPAMKMIVCGPSGAPEAPLMSFRLAAVMINTTTATTMGATSHSRLPKAPHRPGGALGRGGGGGMASAVTRAPATWPASHDALWAMTLTARRTTAPSTRVWVGLLMNMPANPHDRAPVLGSRCQTRPTYWTSPQS